MSVKHVVITGGGIIGCTTAYCLMRHPSSSSITLIEKARTRTRSIRKGWWSCRQMGAPLKEMFLLKNTLSLQKNTTERSVGVGDTLNVEVGGRGEVLLSGEQATRDKSLEKTLGLPGGQKRSQIHKSKKGLPADLTWVKKD